MGEYAEATQKLAETIMPLITESLGLGPKNSTSKLDLGMQVMTINGYPPARNLSSRSAFHPIPTTYYCFAIVLQDSPRLQILDSKVQKWRTVPVIQGALQVHVGNQIEVQSNGKYMSLVHRVTVNNKRTRVLVVGPQTLDGRESGPAEEMVDEENVKGCHKSRFRDFLEFISKNDIGEESSFLNMLKF